MLFPRYAAIKLDYTNHPELGDLDWESEAVSDTRDSILCVVAVNERFPQGLSSPADASSQDTSLAGSTVDAQSFRACILCPAFPRW